jgi:processive 1,2-diacylglycerol beta-glucosyltransferase
VAARVCDPCLSATPALTRALERLYRFGTEHLPRGWKAVYDTIDHIDFNRFGIAATRKPQAWLAALMDEFRPTAVVSTYPVYPYLLDRIFKVSGRRLPVFTVVTDSMAINSAWLRAPTDFWLVTDAATRQSMSARPLPDDRIIDTGFAVNPVFARLRPLPAEVPCEPFRVLFFPTARRRMLVPMASALLEAAPGVRMTMVLGRNVRRLYAEARKVKQSYPGRVRVRGWTRRVPWLLEDHHLVVGKAGGATVHEAIAATCPMLIHHLVPGQEEGNLELLRLIGAGELATRPAELNRRLAAMLAADAAGWRDMKRALIRHDRNSGALAAVRFILDHLAHRP